jgi:hypothetical protein
MPDEFEDNKLEGGEGTEEVELEEKPELPPEPADRNETIDVPVREQKKRNRFKEFEDRATRAEKAAEEARREAQEARALHQQRLAHPQDQSHQQVNPVAQRLRDIDEATDRLHQEYQAVASRPGFTDQQQREYEQRARQLQTAKMAAVAQASAPQFNEQEMYRRWKWNDFTTKHNDIFSHEQAKHWAVGRWQQLVYGEKAADTEDLAEKILDEARIKYGMKPRRGGGGPDAATRARLSGVSAQGGAGGDGGDGGAVRMGKRERQMAEELYDKLPPREAWQKWANGPGKRAALKQSGNRK